MTRDYRLYEEQSRKEAKALLERVAAEVPTDAAALIEDVRRRGGPADALDYSRDSLLALWTWFVETYSLPRGLATHEEMLASGPPWWYHYTGVLAGRTLGPDLARLAHGIACYFAMAVMRARPGTRWVLNTERRNVFYQQPCLDVPGRGIAYPDIEGMAFTACRSLEAIAKGDTSRYGPDGLVALFDNRTTTPQPVAPPTRPWTVDAIGDEDDPRLGRFSHEIGFDESVATDEDERVDAFVAALRGEPGIAQAFREDGELVIVNAPGMATPDLEAIAVRTWAASRG